jgi:hypothetical protein
LGALAGGSAKIMTTESARGGMRGGIAGGVPLVVVRVPPDERPTRRGECFADDWPPWPWPQ